MMEDFKLRGNGEASSQTLEAYREYRKEQKEKEKEGKTNRHIKASGKNKTGKEGRFRQSGKKNGLTITAKKEQSTASVEA